MDDNKEKDEVEEIFNRALEIQDQKKIDEEEEQEEVIPKTGNAEIFAPIIAIILAVASLFDMFWFTAYFGLIFCGVGIYMCRKKGAYIQQWVRILNIVAFIMCLPFNKYRAIVFAGATTVEVGLLVAAAIISYKVTNTESFVYKFLTFGIDFKSLTLVNWFAIAIIIVLAVAIYLIVSYVVEVFKGEHQNAKD